MKPIVNVCGVEINTELSQKENFKGKTHKEKDASFEEIFEKILLDDNRDNLTV